MQLQTSLKDRSTTSCILYSTWWWNIQFPFPQLANEKGMENSDSCLSGKSKHVWNITDIVHAKNTQS
jgi:hypothetical protein